MLQIFKLFLPVIIPSWRFFDVIAPSPRIELTFLERQDDLPQEWQEYRPRPETLAIPDLLRRVVWNADWNESLFLMRCAERLVDGEEEFCREEIFKSIKRDYPEKKFVKFRLIFHAREGNDMEKHLVYMSPVRAL